jgi:flavodoxin I
MKMLVIYDSFLGNTEQIAQAIGDNLGSADEKKVVRVSEVKLEQLIGLKFLIVGSPTRAFRATPAINNLIKGIPKNGLKGVKVTAFDTRISINDINSSIGRFFINLFGYAAKPMSDKLRKKGGELIIPPEGFFVEGTEGPLKEGELKRAADWAKQILATS